MQWIALRTQELAIACSAIGLCTRFQACEISRWANSVSDIRMESRKTLIVSAVFTTSKTEEDRLPPSHFIALGWKWLAMHVSGECGALQEMCIPEPSAIFLFPPSFRPATTLGKARHTIPAVKRKILSAWIHAIFPQKSCLAWWGVWERKKCPFEDGRWGGAQQSCVRALQVVSP